MNKNSERREKFKKLGAAISAMKPGDPNIGDYHTGRESVFEMKRFDPQDRTLHEIPFGPNFNTPQWERTIKTKS